MQCMLKFLEVMPQEHGAGLCGTQKMAVKLPIGSTGQADDPAGFADMMSALMRLTDDQFNRSLTQGSWVPLQGDAQEMVPLIDLSGQTSEDNAMRRMLLNTLGDDNMDGAVLKRHLRAIDPQGVFKNPMKNPMDSAMPGLDLEIGETPEDLIAVAKGLSFDAQSGGEQTTGATVPGLMPAFAGSSPDTHGLRAETAEPSAGNRSPDVDMFEDKKKYLVPDDMPKRGESALTPQMQATQDRLGQNKRAESGDTLFMADADGGNGAAGIRTDSTDDAFRAEAQARFEKSTFQPAKGVANTGPITQETQTDVVRQIVQRMTLHTDGRQSHMQIKLKPAFLGNLHMDVSTENQNVMIRMTAENHRVKEIIEQNIQILKNELQQHGLQIQKIDVSIAQDGDTWRNGQQQSAFRQTHDQTRQGRSFNGETAQEDGEALEGSRLRGSDPGIRGGVDFFA
ncbi:MAG: hypothetical protein VR64_16880 [Desulfatitalea sp. BRH_c12]|nr:MAG: hypothetical protein VR64_16880 [Desulfatitalea sp. BRH_c12]